MIGAGVMGDLRHAHQLLDKYRELDYNRAVDTQDGDTREYYTATDLAEEAGVHFTYTARLCRQGKIPAVKVGGTWIIKFEDGQQWLHEREQRLSNCS